MKTADEWKYYNKKASFILKFVTAYSHHDRAHGENNPLEIRYLNRHHHYRHLY